jgi:signal transduction histidine kinase
VRNRLQPRAARALAWVAATTLAGSLSAGEAAGAGDPPFRLPPEYRVVQWTTAQGLPQNTVTDVVALRDGGLWLATFGGLARFDGHRFRVVDMASDEGLPANRIVSLVPAGAAGDDSFLFLTQQGHLGRVEGGRSALLVPPPAPAVEALELAVDGSGRILGKTADGRAWQTDGRRPWAPVRGPGGAGVFHDFAVDVAGAAWGIWDDRLVRMTGESAPGVPVPPDRDTVLARRTGGGLWLGGRRGLASFVSGRLRDVRVGPPLAGRVTAIEPADDETLWVATTADVSRLDRQADGSWRRTPLPLPVPTSVRMLRLDAEGSLWIGMNGSGLVRVNRLPARHFGAASGLRDVGALARDGAGGALVASGCRGLFHLRPSGHSRPVSLPPGTGRELLPCGISLAAGPWDSVWVRSGSNLFRVRASNLDGRIVTTALPFEEGPIAALPDGGVWVASRSGTVQRVTADGSIGGEQHLPAPLMSASLAPDRSLWLGGDGQVFRVTPQGTERFGPDEGVPRGLVREVLARPDGTLWIGTYGGGVGRLRDGRVARLTVRQGLPDNSVSRILADGRGRLWIATNRGLAVADESEMAAVADGRTRRFAPVLLGSERGVPEANFGSPAGFAAEDGSLWFGTIDGAVRVDAAAFPFNTVPPVVRIEEVRADDRGLPLGPTVRVPPLTARVRVSFTAVELLYPERMRFRFRAEAVDAGWVDAGSERTVDWSPPGPGAYRFLVEARNEDGIWSAAPASVVLDVRPAWWQTSAFHAAVGLAVVLAGVLAMRLRIRGIEHRHAQRLLALQQQRQAEERVAEVRAQLEHVSRAALAGELAASLAHEVRQPIGAIVNNAEAGRRHLAQYLQRPGDLEQLFGDIVDDGLRASEVVQGLRAFLRPVGDEPVPVDLSALVREMLPLVRRELQDHRVAVELSLGDALPPVDGFRVQLGQVVVNLVVNACEALAEKDGERRVAIETVARDGRVELSVRDNGPGLAPAVAARVFEPFVTTKPDGLGVGLAISRSIAERHGGHLSAEAAPEGGTRMVLTLPSAGPREARA